MVFVQYYLFISRITHHTIRDRCAIFQGNGLEYILIVKDELWTLLHRCSILVNLGEDRKLWTMTVKVNDVIDYIVTMHASCRTSSKIQFSLKLTIYNYILLLLNIYLRLYSVIAILLLVSRSISRSNLQREIHFLVMSPRPFNLTNTRLNSTRSKACSYQNKSLVQTVDNRDRIWDCDYPLKIKIL